MHFERSIITSKMMHMSQETKCNTILEGRESQKQRFSVAIIGDSGVGKTSLINRYIFHKFNTDYNSTIEDFYSIQIKLPKTKNDPEKTYVLDLIDTAGLEEFSQVREKSLRDQSAFLFVYKADSKESIDIIEDYLSKIIQLNSGSFNQQSNYQKKPVLIVQNQQDQANQSTSESLLNYRLSRQISSPDLKSLKAKFGNFFEFEQDTCSAKTGEGISRIFQTMTQMIVNIQNAEDLKNFKSNRKKRLIKQKNIDKYYPKNGDYRHCCSFSRYQNCGIF
ncbi:small gtpase [Stylonychia lemnae]|uniref:Small gtpase n=1 Tax=Stylonychia lemnae TaxID=5949 RepID=A0A078A6Q4_STYLE|nr:small gtpase [Stylonychia lemnae]|eukprot:CDW77935.1 small gtpase [Stylonychia lemnae]